jgi:hypothetical protein
MIRYDDSEIDEILWSAIEHSDSAADFAAYLKHKPEGASHIDDAKKRFHTLADGKFDNTTAFESGIDKIRLKADAGGATALFHMGKFLANGTGVSMDQKIAEKW